MRCNSYYVTFSAKALLVVLWVGRGSRLVAGRILPTWPVEMPVSERVELRDEVLRAFRHAYGSYMTHACESIFQFFNFRVLIFCLFKCPHVLTEAALICSSSSSHEYE